MRKSRFSEEQIIAVLKEHDAGAKARDLCRKIGVSEHTFNNRRLLEPIGYVPPAEYEAAYYRNHGTRAKAAGLMYTSLRRPRGDS